MSSLEKTVIEQNILIKKLVSKEQVESRSICNVEVEGDLKAVAGPRPMREARVRASAALSTRKPPISSVAENSTSSVEGVPTSSSQLATTSMVSTAADVIDVVDVDLRMSESRLAAVAVQPIPTSPQVLSDMVNPQENSGDWTMVKRQRNRNSFRNVVRGTAASTTNNIILAAERKSYLHLFYVKIGTTADQVLQHLNNSYPDDSCAVESLKSRGDYASFKISVPAKHVDKYMAPELWAEGVHVKPWRSGFRKESEKVKPA